MSEKDDSPMSENNESPMSGQNGSIVRSVPALARFAAAASFRSARWTLETSARAGTRVVRAAVSGQDPAELLRATEAELRSAARRLLGIRDPHADVIDSTAVEIDAPSEEAARSLRDRGAELLRRSADVHFDEGAHPAYARILDDLAPDEARILRMLADQGPQPAVDVRSGMLPLKSTSELVAAGINMIGTEAGCRHLDDVPAYLNNLFRLGLIWFSSESLPDPLRYQVLEAQPEVTKALEVQGRTRTVRRSIHLTPFGADFCRRCLPLAGQESAGDAGEPDPGQHGNSLS